MYVNFLTRESVSHYKKPLRLRMRNKYGGLRTLNIIILTCVSRKLEICVSQNLTKLGGRPIKCQGWKGERIGVNSPVSTSL